MNAITSLPSLSDLLTQNPNIQPNVQANRLANSSEMSMIQNLGNPVQPNGVETIQIDKTNPTERVTAPGFAQMFEDFIKGVDQRRRFPKEKPKILYLDARTTFTKQLSNPKKQVWPLI